MRWQHSLNESKVKTAECCSPMSPQTKAKSWRAENPDGPSRSSQASKGADEEMLYPEVADFWHPGTIFTGEGHGCAVSLSKSAEGGGLARYQMGICLCASLTVSPPMFLIYILIKCINVTNSRDQYLSTKRSSVTYGHKEYTFAYRHIYATNQRVLYQVFDCSDSNEVLMSFSLL